MDQKLTNDEIIKLIQNFRSHAFLWDMSSKAYRRNDLKVKAYEDIAVQMDMTADVIKKKIRSLRSTYTAEKNKMCKKSGSAADDVYVPTLFWFKEMEFLDSSISIRKSLDNSKEKTFYPENMEDYIEECDSYECAESTPLKQSNKRLRKGVSCSRQSSEDNSKIEEAIDKLMDINDKENEFTSFATSIAYQLQKLPQVNAYELMGEMQNLVTNKIKYLSKENLIPKTSTLVNSTIASSKPKSNIMRAAMSDADIDFDSEYI